MIDNQHGTVIIAQLNKLGCWCLVAVLCTHPMRLPLTPELHQLNTVKHGQLPVKAESASTSAALTLKAALRGSASSGRSCAPTPASLNSAANSCGARG
jgi:hypothetical protein